MLKKLNAKKWHIIMGVFAFLSVGFFFNVNSYYADKQNINGLFIVLGIVFGLCAVLSGGMVAKNSDRGSDKLD